VALPPRPDDTVVGPRAAGLRAAPPVPWPWWEAILVYLVGMVILGTGAAALVLAASDAKGMEIVGSLAADLVFLGAMLSWLGRRCPDWRERLRARWETVQVAIGYVCGLVLYPAVALVAGGAIQWVMEQVSGRTVDQPDQLPSGLSPGFKVVTVLLVVLVAPVTEELFYRGVLYRSIRDRYGRALGMAVSSILFGLAHYVATAPVIDAVFLQIVMICTGLGLAAIYEWRGSLAANVAAHAAFNTVGIILIFSGF
jgi:CAAX protease family protein